MSMSLHHRGFVLSDTARLSPVSLIDRQCTAAAQAGVGGLKTSRAFQSLHEPHVLFATSFQSHNAYIQKHPFLSEDLNSGMHGDR